MNSTTPAPSTGDRAILESVWQDRRPAAWWRLPFPEPLESSFQAHYAQRYRGHMALGLGIGVLAILVTVFEEFLFSAEQRGVLLFIRLGLMLPAAAATAQLFNAIVGSGMGEDDSIAALKLLETISTHQ